MNFQQLKKIAVFYTRFTASYTQIGYLWRRLLWPRTPLDFRGQRWIVTGASGGLGREIALSAARAGAEVTAVARSATKLAQMLAAATAAGIRGIDTEVCDFSLQSDTARFARKIAASGRKIDVLVNNVGIMYDDHTLTSEGRETTFVVNILSHYLLTESLIRAGAFHASGPLVINMTSGGGYNMPLNVRMLNYLDPKTFNGVWAYGFAKRAQIVLNQVWRDTYGPRGFTFYVMHPGWSDTDGVKRAMPNFRRILRLVLRDAASGADTALWLAAARPPQEEKEGVWFDRKLRTAHVYERTRITKDTPQSLVAGLERELARYPDALP